MIWVQALKYFARGMAGKWPPAKPVPHKPDPFEFHVERAGQYRFVLLNTDDPDWIPNHKPLYLLYGDSVIFDHPVEDMKSGDTLQIAYTIEYSDGKQSGAGTIEFDSEGNRCD